MKTTFCAVVLATAAALSLAACGGGSGSQPTVSGQPPVEPPAQEPPPAEPQPDPEPDPDPMPPRSPGPATLTETFGTYSSRTSTVFDIVGGDFVEVPRTYIDIGNWGYDATAADGTSLFTATARASGSITNGEPDYQSYFSSVLGSWSFSNPVEAGGSATWRGGVRGITEDYERVTGTSTIQYHFSTSPNLVDVTFDQFDDGRPSMYWGALLVLLGSFGYGLELDGDFYGANLRASPAPSTRTIFAASLAPYASRRPMEPEVGSISL